MAHGSFGASLTASFWGGPSFDYQPLDASKREIRLVKIIPLPQDESSTDTDAQVECTLQHATLDKPPEYTALSYAWGDHHKTQPVLLDGQVVQITDNLAAGLRQLRANGVVTLWADALCINQSDSEEKSDQVRMIDSIYKNATKVIVWLGVEGDQSEFAMRKIQELGRKACAHGMSHSRQPTFAMSESQIKPSVWETWQSQCDNITISAIHALVRRSWFERVWVIQEVTLGSTVVVACGSQSILWRRLCATNRFFLQLLRFFFDQLGAEWKVLHEMYRRLSPSTFFSSLFDEAAGRSIRQRISLWNMYTSTCLMGFVQCIDPRDRIWGVYGLLESGDREKITVDYSVSATRAISEATVVMLYKEGPDILQGCHRRHSPHQYDLPSWVLDWTPYGLAPDSWFFKLFSASGKFSKVFMDIKHDLFTGVLTLSGALVDVIQSTGSEYNSDTHDERATGKTTLAAWVEEMAGLLPPETTAYNTTTKLHKALWRTPIADSISMPDSFSRRAQAEDELGYQRTFELARRNVLDDLELVTKESRAYKRALELKKQRAFASSRGYLGLGRYSIQSGDEICIFAGARAPFILRRVQDESRRRYKLICMAYVHGIMNGEFIEQNPELELERIELV